MGLLCDDLSGQFPVTWVNRITRGNLYKNLRWFIGHVLHEININRDVIFFLVEVDVHWIPYHDDGVISDFLSHVLGLLLLIGEAYYIQYWGNKVIFHIGWVETVAYLLKYWHFKWVIVHLYVFFLYYFHLFIIYHYYVFFTLLQYSFVFFPSNNLKLLIKSCLSLITNILY